MKFQLVLEANARKLVLRPENDGERQILAALAGDGVDPSGAQLFPEWSNDRAPYKKVLALNIVMGLE